MNGLTPKQPTALEVWREKLAFLEVEKALASTPEQKFEITKRLKECRLDIERLEAEARAEQGGGPLEVSVRWRPQLRTIREIEFCLVPAGPFLMGTPAEYVSELSKAESGKFENEVPQHRAEVNAYLIGRYPVTNRQYKEFVDAVGHRLPFRDDDWSRSSNWVEETRSCRPGREEHPVTLVSWYDAQAYCRWFGARLPTEAEWEKSARGEDRRQWPWGNVWQNERGNAGPNGVLDTTPVSRYGERGQSPYGVRDLAGNIWEWTSSLADPYPYDAEDSRESPDGLGRRIHRGGAWFISPFFARCAARGSADPNDFGFNLGFRLVLPAETP